VAREYQLTLNTFVQGAWAVLLSHHSETQDVVFGATLSGRPATLPGVETMVGPFINTLPVRIRVEREQRLMNWLKQLQEEQAEMRQYEHSPLVEVQGWSEVPRGVPLFESNFVFENYPLEALSYKRETGLAVYSSGAEITTSFPLTFAVIAWQKMGLQMQFDQKRFSPASIKRLLKTMETLLGLFIAHPDSSLGEIEEMLTEANRRQGLAEEEELKGIRSQKFKNIRRRPVNQTQVNESTPLAETATHLTTAPARET
jgi:non-ribosomal peptide synthetase component F